jgi:hypothetical protein
MTTLTACAKIPTLALGPAQRALGRVVNIPANQDAGGE